MADLGSRQGMVRCLSAVRYVGEEGEKLSQSLRLLFGIRTLANPGGGAERVLADLTARLAERGHDVQILTFDSPDARPFYAFHPSVAIDGIGIGDPSRSANPAESLRRILPLRRAALLKQPDVAVGFMHSMFIPLGLALVGTGIPMVASEHIGHNHYFEAPWWHRAVLSFTPALSQVAVVPSEGVRSTYSPRLSRKMRSIPNPVSVAIASTDSGTRDRTILTIGRLSAQKDHSTLLAAFAKLSRHYPEWQLEILGDGELRPQLEEQIEALGIADRVLLHGVVQDVDTFLQRAAIVAVSSRYESFGLATGEALAAGVPAVGFDDCLGTNELIVDGVNGLLVAGESDPSARATSLAAGLERLMADKSLRARLGAAGPSSITRFDPERVADAWETLLQTMAS